MWLKVGNHALVGGDGNARLAIDRQVRSQRPHSKKRPHPRLVPPSVRLHWEVETSGNAPSAAEF